ncbi:hypothetical protein Taro_036970 [Colocasia esculenta]|uniref:Uncharacterized protein n=1 Tax=Colocasia esculenta TaxID=4460 RepID=A0A843W8C6_COLES|nr:hypothetical protein [Colocasia esculenta]
MSNAVQAQLSQTLSQAISQALSQASIPPQAAPSTSTQAPHHGQGNDCDLGKLTEFNLDSRFQVCGSPARFVCVLQELLSFRERGECGRSVCSCRSGAVGGGLAGSGLPSVEDGCRKVQDFSQDCSMLVSAVVVLPKGLRYAVVLAGAFWRVFPEWCLGGSGGGSPRTGLRCFYSLQCFL